MDIVFIIDSSGSIQDAGPDNWDLILDFVVQVIEGHNVGETATRFGLVKFSTDGTIEIYLDDYFEKNLLIDAVREVSFVGGRTNTADGLQLAWEDLFNTNRGDRSDVTNVAIMVTDGNANERENEIASEANLLKLEAQVIAIGITDQVSMDTLEAIASDTAEIIIVDDFTELASEVDSLMAGVCVTDTPSMYIYIY